jgi:hypothetical protein
LWTAAVCPAGAGRVRAAVGEVRRLERALAGIVFNISGLGQ